MSFHLMDRGHVTKTNTAQNSQGHCPTCHPKQHVSLQTNTDQRNKEHPKVNKQKQVKSIGLIYQPQSSEFLCHSKHSRHETHPHCLTDTTEIMLHLHKRRASHTLTRACALTSAEINGTLSRKTDRDEQKAIGDMLIFSLCLCKRSL